MYVLGVLFLIMVPCLGILINEIGREKKINQIETYLTGFFFLFFVQGVVFFIGIQGDLSFQKTAYLLCGLLGILSLVGVIIGRKKIKQYVIPLKLIEFLKEKKNKYFFLSFVLILGLQLYTMISYVPMVREDIMLETIQTTLATDTMYQFHPLSGQAMHLGMIMSKKIITLPLWYSCISLVTNWNPAVVIYTIASFATLVASYGAYICLFSVMFRKNVQKVILATNFLGLLYLAGDYASNAMGYGQLYYGYSGEIICISVAIPYILYVMYADKGNCMLRMFKMSICGMSLIFMTSIQTGVLYAILIIGIILLMRMIMVVRRKKQCKMS